MIDRIEIFARRVRRWFSRSERLIKLLRLDTSENTATEPGLVIIQIDGLARHQLERALKKKRMPFLSKLIRHEHYELMTHYSGIPSSTPAVQGELFYGVKCAVPAFSFYNSEAGRVFTMFTPDDAEWVEQRLAAQGEPLLRGGSSYCNIYTAGAAHPCYCAASLGFAQIFKNASQLALPVMFVFHVYSFLRLLVLLPLELALSLWDALRGVFTGGQHADKEFKFVFSRVVVTLVMRELVTIGAKLDAARGVPIVHLNLLGYDEQAHRRGPSSRFAHWTLKGIDDAIKRITTAARRSNRRDYDIWIFSDHGQADTKPYIVEHGETIEQAIARILDRKTFEPGTFRENRSGEQAQRPRMFRRRCRPESDEAFKGEHAGKPVVCAMGPVGHIYLPADITLEARDSAARRLVQEAKVPLVLSLEQSSSEYGHVRAWNEHGEFILPRDRAQVFGETHPFLDEVADDVVRLCQHEFAGDIVFVGMRLDGKHVSFPVENGAHAGPGPQETAGFALVPSDAPIARRRDPRHPGGLIRPTLLREGALRHMGRLENIEAIEHEPPSTEPGTLRIMTYNVHSCVGMDGKISTRRIARVIEQYQPDVVALQELDVGRLRTQGLDQAQLIARHLRMDYHFHPHVRLEEELYGDALLSRFPMRLVHAGGLPTHPRHNHLEPRGALWVTIDVDGSPVQIINTHLGLLKLERMAQARALVGPEWIGHPDCIGPVVLCGDFNALPGTAPYKTLCRGLRDAQKCLKGHRPTKTWFGRHPVGRIDHVFVSPGLEITRIHVARSRLAKVASDHLPLIVDIQVPANSA
jgi:endonuclease/exonuclease/phosphatase family metal-dependent hydrolase